jgi:hypothetical protein
VIRNTFQESRPPTRGEITHFSRQARFRWLKRAAEIDWQKIDKAIFVTVTYPDEALTWDRHVLKADRKRFWQDLERYVIRPISAIWRTEWVPRKSGLHVGKVSPHHHYLIFGVTYIDKTVTNELWKKSIGVKCYTRTETKSVGAGDVAAFYVSKYCAKASSGHSLVDVTKRHNTGRQIGWLRRERIPRKPLTCIEDIGEKAYIALVRCAAEIFPWVVDDVGCGFTVLGASLRQLDAVMRHLGLDAVCDGVYDA